MADGTTRDTDDITVGDLVLAADLDTGETRAEPVTDLIIGSGEKDLVTITADPDADGHPDLVIATAGHPFYTQAGWRDAEALVVGDRLTGPTGTTFAVTGDSREPRRTSTVYNLTVDVDHTYFVLFGNQPALVHKLQRRACESSQECGHSQKSLTVYPDEGERWGRTPVSDLSATFECAEWQACR